MPKKISVIQKREWLSVYEQGKSIISIAKKSKRDVRTVKDGIDDARRERDVGLARAEMLKEALRKHQESLQQELQKIAEQLKFPHDDYAPLSWYEGEASVFSPSEGKMPDSVSSLSILTSTTRELLWQHLKRDKLRKLLPQWEKLLEAHLADRAALQRELVKLLQQKTGYPVQQRSDKKKPFLCSYTIGPLLYKAAMDHALKKLEESDLEQDIRADVKGGEVRHGNLTLAEAPGHEAECRQHILEAYQALLLSDKLTTVKISNKALKEMAIKSGQLAEELLLLGYIPGGCSVCHRIGL